MDWFNSWDEVAEYVASLPAGHNIMIDKKAYFKAANCDNTHIYESFFCPETGKIIHFSHLIKPNNLEEEEHENEKDY